MTTRTRRTRTRWLAAPVAAQSEGEPYQVAFMAGQVGIPFYTWDFSERFKEDVVDDFVAEYAAAWSVDSERSGIEKLFGGFSATTRDHARIGLLFLHGGTLDGRSLVWRRSSFAEDAAAGARCSSSASPATMRLT